MKIRLAILERDLGYLNRITAAFNTNYGDKIEVYSFTDEAAAAGTLGGVDVVLAYEGCDIKSNPLSQRCAFAFLVDRQGVDRLDGYPAICKFQKVDAIYKQILNLYAEVASGIVGAQGDGAPAKVLLFASPCGGTGTSTLAAACAMHFAAERKRVLYLNLEVFGGSGTFFAGAGQFGLSDVVLALKNRKANLQMKLESCVRQDASGVFFFAEPAVALDRMELEDEEILRLVMELKASGQYDYIIVDMDFALDGGFVELYRQMDAVVWVSDGTRIADGKVERARACAETLGRAGGRLADEILLIYNKISDEGGRADLGGGVRVLGRLARYKSPDARQIAAIIASSDIFNQLR